MLAILQSISNCGRLPAKRESSPAAETPASEAILSGGAMRSDEWRIPVGEDAAAVAKAEIAAALQRKRSDRQTWRDIWMKKGADPHFANLHLLDLVRIDGCDTPWTPMTEEKWLAMVGGARARLGLSANESILEVGCGSGAFLYPFARSGLRVAGVDYSPTLVAIARAAMPGGAFHEAEARKLPFADNEFDAIISMGVIIYFADLAYTAQALDEMLRVAKTGASGLILSINDAAKRASAEGTRERLAGGVEEYRRLYGHLPQLYYDKSWFAGFCRDRNVRFDLIDQAVSESESSEWRYDFYFELPEQ